MEEKLYMETLTSKEYADMISASTDDIEVKEAYEANLIAMGKDSACMIQDGYNEGKLFALKHIMDTYNAVKNHYATLEGLTYDVLDVMLAECAAYIMEEI
jgi:hypothetical protein